MFSFSKFFLENGFLGKKNVDIPEMDSFFETAENLNFLTIWGLPPGTVATPVEN